MMKKIAVIAALLVIVIGGALLLFRTQGANVGATGKVHEIVLTKEGFKPDTVTIKKGDAIKFSTNAGEPFWPASDIHPTHGIYPEFDPKEALDPNNTWSYVFQKTGKWRFHDHIAPQFIGVITVE